MSSHADVIDTVGSWMAKFHDKVDLYIELMSALRWEIVYDDPIKDEDGHLDYEAMTLRDIEVSCGIFSGTLEQYNKSKEEK